ncbi:MAG: hypothetical protein ACM3XS_06025 [Bacteroidota bacterium]
MRRYMSCISTVVVLLCLMAEAAFAAPPAAGGGASWFIYGEYAHDAYMFPGAGGPAIGVGRGARGGSFGILLQYAGNGADAWPVYGIFAGLRRAEFLLEGHLLTNGEAVFGRAAALYMIPARRAALTAGGGLLAENKYGETWFFLEGGVRLTVAPKTFAYAALDYTLDEYGDILIKFGISRGF